MDVPAGNTEATDPYLTSCAFVDVRRIEPGYPQELETSPTQYVALDYEMDGTGYQVDLEVESFNGSGFQLGYFYTESKAQNGFDIYYNGTADNLNIRWTARKLDM
jgi:hypothetical protein